MDKAAYKRFVFDASNGDAEVYAKHCDLILLALIGFIAIGHGNWAKVKYAENDPNFLLAANRLQLFSPEVSFEELRANVPFNDGPVSNLDQDSASIVCEALVNLLKGFPVAIDKLPDIYDLAVHANIPPSQPEQEVPDTKPEEQQALTQVPLGKPEASDDEPPAKRLRNQPLQVADLRNQKDAMTQTLAWIFKQKNPTFLQWRLNEKVRDVHQTVEKPWELAAKVTQVLVSATLASPTAEKTNSFDLAKLPPEAAASVADELQKVGILKPADKPKVTEQFGKRKAEDLFQEGKFRDCMRLCAEAFKD
eukprot:Skav224872  [mRNA]  locus=scaffold1112:106653:107573:- [translate_table: standard]